MGPDSYQGSSMKTYEFEKKYYVIEVPVTAAFCAAMLCLSTYNIVAQKTNMPAVYGMFIVAAVYQLWNLLVSHAYPRYVHLDDESITFELWGRKDRYDFADLDRFLVRSNPQNGRMFIRAGKESLFNGRYWISTKKYTDGDELFHSIDAIELAVHPDSLKALARGVDAQYMEEANEFKEKRAAAKRRRGKKGSKAHNAALGTKAQNKE